MLYLAEPGGHCTPGPSLLGGIVITVIPQSFEADLDVLRSHWQRNHNFERQIQICVQVQLVCCHPTEGEII